MAVLLLLAQSLHVRCCTQMQWPCVYNSQLQHVHVIDCCLQLYKRLPTVTASLHCSTLLLTVTASLQCSTLLLTHLHFLKCVIDELHCYVICLFWPVQTEPSCTKTVYTQVLSIVTTFCSPTSQCNKVHAHSCGEAKCSLDSWCPWCWCSGVQSFLVTYFNTIIWMFHDWFL